MKKDEFERYYQDLLKKARKVRAEGEEEYFSEGDVLANFRKVAAFRDRDDPETVMDLGAKPLVSISDMINASFGSEYVEDEKRFSLAEWDRKFVSALNYFFKLYASVRERL